MTDVDTTAGAVGWENAPDHYKGSGGIENFDVWDAYRMDPYTANAFKYLARWDKKGSPLNDLRKARHYLDETEIRMGDGRITRHVLGRLPRHLLPSQVCDAFGLSGSVRSAVYSLLLSFFTFESDVDFHTAKRYVERAIKAIEDSQEGQAS